MRVVLFMMATGCLLLAGEAEDKKMIEAAVGNYVHGWFESDAARMKAALHPNLSKYIVESVPETGVEYLRGVTAERMVAIAAGNQKWVKDKNTRSMKILYQDQRIAVVYADSDGFYDIVNLVKINGEWKIIQVLWDRIKE